ncbi:hypothetical protein NEILACOT_04439 [Neisseria lactamica ATCC 23970]|uniref:Uncharacterized protein n=1 Tax=Neisseria lactamica ATCC 23970 TaxID=546265 RepID=D0WA70_NEILA|nr:hypothetical protein NEILACOT_04439 [Neisseria lactamica ATCC 23970]
MPSEAVFRRHFCGFPVRFFQTENLPPLIRQPPGCRAFPSRYSITYNPYFSTTYHLTCKMRKRMLTLIVD